MRADLLLFVGLYFGYFVVRWLFCRLRFITKRHESLGGLRLPFEGWWYVAVGGRVFPNHHLGAPAQQFAYDFCMALNDSGKTSHDPGKALEDFLCYDAPILAAHDGEVLVAVDGVPDNEPGELNPQMVYGNTVMIRHPEGPVSVYAHLKCHSVVVQEGESVEAGNVLGRCGNSGNSTEPHLHFHIQNEVGFEKGVGIRPIFTDYRTKISLDHDGTLEETGTPRFPEFVAPTTTVER